MPCAATVNGRFVFCTSLQLCKALVEEMAAHVKEAEAEVPRAMADSFRSGNLGIMDYYRMRNIQSDTEMRTSISESTDENSA